MAVDPRQVVAGFLTLSMFVMLGNMIKHDHFSPANEVHLPLPFPLSHSPFLGLVAAHWFLIRWCFANLLRGSAVRFGESVLFGRGGTDGAIDLRRVWCVIRFSISDRFLPSLERFFRIQC